MRRRECAGGIPAKSWEEQTTASEMFACVQRHYVGRDILATSRKERMPSCSTIKTGAGRRVQRFACALGSPAIDRKRGAPYLLRHPKVDAEIVGRSALGYDGQHR
eukprot:1050550-Prymnesium_polylepis.1